MLTFQWNISVVGVGDQGFWEGRVNGNEGLFPSNHVQEVKLRRRGNYMFISRIMGVMLYPNEYCVWMSCFVYREGQGH